MYRTNDSLVLASFKSRLFHDHGTHCECGQLSHLTFSQLSSLPWVHSGPFDNDKNVRIAMGQGQYDACSLTESVDLVIRRVTVATFFTSFILNTKYGARSAGYLNLSLLSINVTSAAWYPITLLLYIRTGVARTHVLQYLACRPRRHRS